MKAYRKQFSVKATAPYLGPFPGMVHCTDIEELPRSAKFVSLGRGCRNIDRLPTRKRLQRVHTELSEDLVEHLADLPNLRYVQFRLPRSDSIPRLSPLTQIQTLVLKCNKHQSSLNFLKGLENLHSLCVSEAMGVSRLTPISSLIELRELYIDGTISKRNTIQSLAPIGKLASLRYAVLLLRVERSNRSLRPLHKLSQLEFLHLSHDYDDVEYEKLVAKLPRLAEIRFNAGMRWPSRSP